MTPEMEKKLQVLIDKQEIHDILMGYCRGVDRGDRELIARAYHDDAIDDHGDFVVNAAEVADLFVQMGGRPSHGGMHFIGNVLIEVEGDVAWAESYFMAIKDVDINGERKLRTRAGRYIDRFERRGGRWAIAERVLADDWNRVQPTVEILGGAERYRMGRRDGQDLVQAIRKGRVAREKIG